MTNIQLFESNQVRTIWNDVEEKWYISIVDVIERFRKPQPKKILECAKNKT